MITCIKCRTREARRGFRQCVECGGGRGQGRPPPSATQAEKEALAAARAERDARDAEYRAQFRLWLRSRSA